MIDMNIEPQGLRLTANRNQQPQDARLSAERSSPLHEPPAAENLRLSANMELARRLVHALNNALCVILNHAEFLEEDLAGHPAAEDVQRVLAGVQKAAEISGGLQSLATTSTDAVPLASFLRSVTAMVEWESGGLHRLVRPREFGQLLVAQNAVAELVVLELARWHGRHLVQEHGELAIGCSLRCDPPWSRDVDQEWLVVEFPSVGSCTNLHSAVPASPTPRNLQMLAGSIGAKVVAGVRDTNAIELWLPLQPHHAD